MKTTFKVLATAAAIATASATGASAGGLFGNGGLVRGDIGNVLHKAVEKPVTSVLQPVQPHAVAPATPDLNRLPPNPDPVGPCTPTNGNACAN